MNQSYAVAKNGEEDADPYRKSSSARKASPENFEKNWSGYNTCPRMLDGAVSHILIRINR
jgi:hypothetical protein